MAEEHKGLNIQNVNESVLSLPSTNTNDPPVSNGGGGGGSSSNVDIVSIDNTLNNVPALSVKPISGSDPLHEVINSTRNNSLIMKTAHLGSVGKEYLSDESELSYVGLSPDKDKFSLPFEEEEDAYDYDVYSGQVNGDHDNDDDNVNDHKEKEKEKEETREILRGLIDEVGSDAETVEGGVVEEFYEQQKEQTGLLGDLGHIPVIESSVLQSIQGVAIMNKDNNVQASEHEQEQAVHSEEESQAIVEKSVSDKISDEMEPQVDQVGQEDIDFKEQDGDLGEENPLKRTHEEIESTDLQGSMTSDSDTHTGSNKRQDTSSPADKVDNTKITSPTGSAMTPEENESVVQDSSSSLLPQEEIENTQDSQLRESIQTPVEQTVPVATDIEETQDNNTISVDVDNNNVDVDNNNVDVENNNVDVENNNVDVENNNVDDEVFRGEEEEALGLKDEPVKEDKPSLSVEEDELELQRHKGYEDICDIETEFAELRQAIYENKVKKMQMELQMCLDGSHPALQQYLAQVQAIRDYKLQKIYFKQQYRLDCIDRETRATRYIIHQDFYKKTGDLKEEMLNETTTQWYDINNERRDLDLLMSNMEGATGTERDGDYGYLNGEVDVQRKNMMNMLYSGSKSILEQESKFHVPIKIANKSLSMITGYSTQPAIKANDPSVAFSAMASSSFSSSSASASAGPNGTGTTAASSDGAAELSSSTGVSGVGNNNNNDEDMECENIEWKFANNPVDKLEVIVDRMRFNNMVSDFQGLRKYYGGFPSAPELSTVKEVELMEDFTEIHNLLIKKQQRLSMVHQAGETSPEYASGLGNNQSHEHARSSSSLATGAGPGSTPKQKKSGRPKKNKKEASAQPA